jgi:hypothetical protein
MKNAGNIFLNRVAYIFLALAILNLSQGCKVFRSVEKSRCAGHKFEKYEQEGKYFILYSGNEIYHLSDIRIIGGTLMGTLSEVSDEHLFNCMPPGKKPKGVSVDVQEILSREVILVTRLRIPSGLKVATIPLRSIDKIYIYKMKLTTGSVIAIVLCSLLLVSPLIWLPIDWDQL